jgi:putative flippase GtrA
VAVVEFVLARIPQPYRAVAIRHRELVKFALVGGIAFIVDTTVFALLKTTVLAPKPVTAKIIAVLVATIVGYVLNREWSFRTRGGRERHHEAALYFTISGIGLVINAAPLWISRYAFHLQVPEVSRLTMEIADFTSAQIVGTLLAMAFRWWAFRRFVFPDANARPRVPALAGTVPAADRSEDLRR